ncbi:MAG: ATPase, T2SS/T4P/T4SS family [Planctomycetaceae bacterium]|jgi:pilus assembly protein CpaF|nr:ATPase, T2SS/T4P/T4SS family [Planctomycetaceae bacterium]
MTREAIFEASLDFFLGPIRELLSDETVTEVMVNGFDEIYIERRGQLIKTEASFADPDALLSAVHNVAQYVGREIDEDRPVLDARLPDGSRVHAVIPPSARGGTYLTIRKFQRDILGLGDFVRLGSLSETAREFLELSVILRKNLVVAGGTGTGKTTMLNAVSTSIPEEERIVVIEDSSELRLAQAHCLYLESQQADSYGRGEINIRDLFRASLRMRPDRILVGEVRGGEALDMVQSMISGHSGSLTTVHATSPRDALVRLETLSLMSDVDLPVYVARAQVASAIHLIVQLSRFSEDGSRKVTRITEVHGLDDTNRYQAQDLFVNRLTGRDEQGMLIADLSPTGTQPTFAGELVAHALDHRVQHTHQLWGLDSPE